MVDLRGRPRSSNIEDRRWQKQPRKLDPLMNVRTWNQIIAQNPDDPIPALIAYRDQKQADKRLPPIPPAYSLPFGLFESETLFGRRPQSGKDIGIKSADPRTKRLFQEGYDPAETMAGEVTYRPFEPARLTGSGSNDTLRGDPGTDLTLQTIMDAEGFRSNAYWDRNAYRVGYGSDTYVDANGKVQKVTKNTSGITRDQALADLQRRVPEFQQNGIIKYVGQQAWTQLSPETKAAVTSLAYNYGSISELPSLKRAIQSGNVTDIAAAIKARGSDNGGINKSRRIREAAMVAPLQPVVPPPPNRGVPETATAAITRMLGNDAGVSALGYAPPMQPLPAPTPLRPPTNTVRPGVPGSLPGAPFPLSAVRPEGPPGGLPVPPFPLSAVRPEGPAGGFPAAPRPVPSFVRPEMPAGGLPALPRPPESPRLSDSLEWKLSELAENYVPTDKRPRVGNVTGEGLTIRPVQTVPVPPDSPLAGNVPPVDMQSVVNRVAEQRRRAMTGADPVVDPMAGELRRRMAAESLVTQAPMDPLTMEVVVAPRQTTVAGRPTVPVGSMPGARPPFRTASLVRPELPAAGLPRAPNPYGGSPVFGDDPDQKRLTAGVPLEPNIPYGPPMPPKTGEPPVPPTGTTRLADLPRWMRTRKGVPPEEQTNPDVYEVLAGIADGSIPDTGMFPSKGTGAIIKQLTSPGANLLGEMNAGKRPFMSFLAKMFLTRDPSIATSRSTGPLGWQATYNPTVGQSWASSEPQQLFQQADGTWWDDVNKVYRKAASTGAGIVRRGDPPPASSFGPSH
jgi:GH24 family phage-related lysozyme (muramidase)